jgi:proline dehydrogenase
MPQTVKGDVNHLSFDNTEVAFAGKSDYDLKRAYWLFKLIGSNTLVKFSKPFANLAVDLHLPIGPIVRQTLYKQFCGGETIKDCNSTMKYLADYGVGTILDYSVEGKGTTADFERVVDEVLESIEQSKTDKRIAFAVFKVTGLAPFSILEKVSAKDKLTKAEQDEWDAVQQRVATLCKAAAEADTPIFLDAEESWIQEAVDQLCYSQMELYNQVKPIVYNTIQLYLTERYAHMVDSHKKAVEKGYIPGYKLVRGAYMEKERKRAEKQGYQSPVQVNKQATDDAYNGALKYSVEHIETLAICAGSHNENSCMYLAELMQKAGLPYNHKHIYFSQLLGMSDHISFNLAHAGYNVAKYVPYGPVRDVLPYLLRRAEENTSVAGQTPRELSLLIKERKRRK